jgi:glycosyltransferase 2 family protein
MLRSYVPLSSSPARAASWRWLARLVASATLIMIAVLVVDIRAVPRVLATMPATAFLLAFALNLIGSIIVPAVQTRIALSATRLRLDVRRLIAINLMIRFYILVLPRPAAVGLRWWAYRERGDESRGAEAAALMLFERAVQGLVITAAAAILLAAEHDQLPAVTGAVWAVTMLLLATSVVVAAAFVWSPATELPRWLLQRRSVPGLLKDRATRLLDAVAAYPGMRPVRTAAIIGLSVLYFILFVASFQVLLHALGVQLSFAAVAWIRAVVFVMTLLPVTIAGIGIRELGFVALLKLYGVPETLALAAAFAALAVQLLIGCAGLIVALWWQWRGLTPRQEVAVTPAPPVPE